MGSEANDVKQGAGTNNQLEDHEISEEKFHHNPADAEKENTLDRTSSQESSAFSTTASAVKVVIGSFPFLQSKVHCIWHIYFGKEFGLKFVLLVRCISHNLNIKVSFFEDASGCLRCISNQC